MRRWFDAVGRLGLDRGVSFDLDFHTIPFHGEDAMVEKHYVFKGEPILQVRGFLLSMGGEPPRCLGALTPRFLSPNGAHRRSSTGTPACVAFASQPGVAVLPQFPFIIRNSEEAVNGQLSVRRSQRSVHST
jgi:hypothetical protein